MFARSQLPVSIYTINKFKIFFVEENWVKPVWIFARRAQLLQSGDIVHSALVCCVVCTEHWLAEDKERIVTFLSEQLTQSSAK